MSKSPSNPLAELRPAATVIVLRDAVPAPEIFMVRRHEGTAFMGGAHVFPGGRVDVADFDAADDGWCDGIAGAASRLSDLPKPSALAHHVAAARELFEEAGVLLARDTRGGFVALADQQTRDRFTRDRTDVHAGTRSLRDIVEREGLRLALDALLPFAHWVTPPVDTRRFDTWFFVTRVPPEQVAAHDETETTHSTWISAADAIRRANDDIILPPPTWTTLRELEPFHSVDDVETWARARPISRREPRFFEENGERMLLLPGDPLNPEPAIGDPPTETRFVWTNDRWRAQTSVT